MTRLKDRNRWRNEPSFDRKELDERQISPRISQSFSFFLSFSIVHATTKTCRFRFSIRGANTQLEIKATCSCICIIYYAYLLEHVWLPLIFSKRSSFTSPRIFAECTVSSASLIATPCEINT